jgi:hypothetical protein
MADVVAITRRTHNSVTEIMNWPLSFYDRFADELNRQLKQEAKAYRG